MGPTIGYAANAAIVTGGRHAVIVAVPADTQHQRALVAMIASTTGTIKECVANAAETIGGRTVENAEDTVAIPCPAGAVPTTVTTGAPIASGDK